MGKEMRITSVLLIMIVAGIVSGIAYAKPDTAKKEKAACALCHVNPAGGKDLSEVGRIYQEKQEIPTDAVQVPADKQANFIGDKDCAACHTAEFSTWEKTMHAAAFKPLVEKKAEINERCNICHATGAGLPGGYADGTDTLRNVTCEACHGPGSLHANSPMKQLINGTPGEVLCRSCHTERFSPKFEFTEWVKKGVHDLPDKKPTTGSEAKK